MLNHRNITSRKNTKGASIAVAYQSQSQHPQAYEGEHPPRDVVKAEHEKSSHSESEKMSSIAASSASNVAEFDALRREATKLERHLEEKVAKYQQVSFEIFEKIFSIDSGYVYSKCLLALVISCKIYH